MGCFFFRNNEGTEYKVILRKPNKKHFSEDCDGYCTSPEENEPKIQINPYLTKQTELNTSLHEFTHAFFWDKPETDVKRFADVCSNFLYQNGWRLQHRNFPSPTRKKKK